jgi:hypothetical protein
MRLWTFVPLRLRDTPFREGAKRIENCPSRVEEFANFAKFCEALAK